jgi:hypothetical protein
MNNHTLIPKSAELAELNQIYQLNLFRILPLRRLCPIGRPRKPSHTPTNPSRTPPVSPPTLFLPSKLLPLLPPSTSVSEANLRHPFTHHHLIFLWVFLRASSSKISSHYLSGDAHCRDGPLTTAKTESERSRNSRQGNMFPTYRRPVEAGEVRTENCFRQPSREFADDFIRQPLPRTWSISGYPPDRTASHQ